MTERVSSRFDVDLCETVDRLRTTVLRIVDDPTSRLGDSPSGEETRELLGLFAKLQSEEVRRAVLDLMRTIVEVPA